MFKIESYVTPILLSYVDKYVRDFNPADAQVSLWKGGVTLHNLVLKADVLQQELDLPFTLVSGRIHELLIQVPWTKVMSEPIVITINTIECILSLNPPPDGSPQPEAHSSRTQVVEAPPGYMQALVRKIVSNIKIRVHSLIVKYVHDDIVMSLNVKHLTIDSAGPNWEPAYADIDQNQPALRRLVRLDDLTLCLDQSDSDGKIRFFNEPLLYRCQLDLRVLTTLISAHTRRARSVSVQLSSSQLAWGVNNQQLVLLMRLFKETVPVEVKPPPPVAKPSNAQVTPMNAASATSAESARNGSWSEWALSWLPTFDNEGVEETPASATPVPVYFTAHFDRVSLVLKMMDLDTPNRKRAHNVLELVASDAVIKSSLCSPTFLRVKFGTRLITLTASNTRCPCGVVDQLEEPIIYLKKIESENEEPWSYVQEELIDEAVETAVAVDEEFKDLEGNPTEKPTIYKEREGSDEFWQKMAPVLSIEYIHDRAPSDLSTNPYDNPPRNFEYSDWQENTSLMVSVRPISIDISTGLLHRLSVFKNALSDLPTVEEPEIAMRTLTVEECDALSENLPLRHASIEIIGLRIRVNPSNHTNDRNKSPLVLDLQLPHTSICMTGPLYPHRVSSAACQMVDDSGVIWQGARLHMSLDIDALQVGICSPEENNPRVCARAKIHAMANWLLNSSYFRRAERVLFGYMFTLQEANICGSAARLQAAYHILQSLKNGKLTYPLEHTSLAADALRDQDSVAIDLTLEDLTLRGYVTKNIHTHFVTLNSGKATVFHSPTGGELKQAWLFSAPETPTPTPYLRIAMQWCKAPNPSCLEFVRVTITSTALSVDPLLVTWLAYQPTPNPPSDTLPQLPSVKSTQNILRRRFTPPSSSGRGGSRPASAAELVHIRPRSIASSSEKSEMDRKMSAIMDAAANRWWSGENLLKLYERFNRFLLTAEVGLIQVYVTPTSVSAIDCANVRDAMERYAITTKPVFVASLGQITFHSSFATQHLWQEVRYDRPTYYSRESNEDSFPWKTRLVDMSCYTLEVSAEKESTGKGKKSAAGHKSQLKATKKTVPKPVLDLVTTTITLSVATKTRETDNPDRPGAGPRPNDDILFQRPRQFTRGIIFRPKTLKEFIRGPVRRSRNSSEPEPEPFPEPTNPPTTNEAGPVVAIGFYVHADTPPIKFRIDQDQVQTVAVTIHCLNHAMTLLLRPAVAPAKILNCCRSARRAYLRAMSERDGRLDDAHSENFQEHLISIFEENHTPEIEGEIKTIFWFQWVVSRATLIVTMPEVKLAFDADDIMTTVDLQNEYKQFRLKIASVSIKHYKRTDNNEWIPGQLGGRIVQVREPVNFQQVNHFFAITVTQARISGLPEHWRELHKKLFEQNYNTESITEVYSTLAPLEVALQPHILDLALSWLHEFTTQAFCSLNTEEIRPTHSSWPFLYIDAGGVRILLINVDEKESTNDDTLVVDIGKVAIHPNPENPISRQQLNTPAELSLTSSGEGLEGMQYEVETNQMTIKSAKLNQLVIQEMTESEILKGIGGENPAVKWSQPAVAPIMIPIVHPVDLSSVLAPPIYTCEGCASGPAVEFNILSNCTVEVAVKQLKLLQSLSRNLLHAFRNRLETSVLRDEVAMCPYGAILINQGAAAPNNSETETTISEEAQKPTEELNPSSSQTTFDSGVDTVKSQSTFNARRSASVMKSTYNAGADNTTQTSDNLEVFITMGVVFLTLYVRDDGSLEVHELKPPPIKNKAPPKPKIQVYVIDEHEEKKDDEKDVESESKNLVGDDDNEPSKEHSESSSSPRIKPKLTLVFATLNQTNLYYLKRKDDKTIQVSVFNGWLGLKHRHWQAPLLITRMGAVDPITSIPPALFTMKMNYSTGSVPVNGPIGRGAIQLDVEKSIMFEICMDRLQRIKKIMDLVEKNTLPPEVNIAENLVEPTPILHKMRSFMASRQIERITIETNQIGIRGSEGVIGWESSRLQSLLSARPDRLNTRVLITAACVTAGPEEDKRHVVLQPVTMGFNIDSSWETWRKLESGLSTQAPTVRVGLDFDHVILEIRPKDVLTLVKLQNLLKDAVGLFNAASTPECASSNTDQNQKSSGASSVLSFFSKQYISSDSMEPTINYYTDDFRSGAFKMVSDYQLPMAYQVALYGSSVSWRYPHPRTITRLIARPVPGLEEEVECSLEFFCPMLNRWEPQTYFKLPVSEPKEITFSMMPHDLVFALIWRVRVCSDLQKERPAFVFDSSKYLYRRQNLIPERSNIPYTGIDCKVTAQQLVDALQVDSFFAPRLTPGARVTLRVADLEINVHNTIPVVSRHINSTQLAGYYLTRPMIDSHRVLSLRLRDSTVHCMVAMTSTLVCNTYVSSDMLDSASGAMGQLIDEFRVQSTVSLSPERWVRARLGAIRVAIFVPRVMTLRSLLDDWIDMYKTLCEGRSETQKKVMEHLPGAVSILCGLAPMWVHNKSTTALYFGQEGTEEIIMLDPGASAAYRWKSPTAPKKIHLSRNNYYDNWLWSSGIPFTEHKERVRIDNGEDSSQKMYVHVRVIERSTRIDMYLSGKVVLANMLRLNLLYKICARYSDKVPFGAINVGELQAESIGLSVLCDLDWEMVLKIKFASNDLGWSGEIPLKECRKENVPWLVKVPTGVEMMYTAIWCRVIHTEKDNSIMIVTWPFYIFRSHLPLDVLITLVTQNQPEGMQHEPPRIRQKGNGRGAVSHIIAAGTTASWHMLTFHYYNSNSPVPLEAIPLHYGVNIAPVFERPATADTIEEIIDILKDWLARSGRQARTNWPYSIVTNHWPSEWQPPRQQPRCDILVEYHPVNACGGSSLELELSPVVLFANASPLKITLRGNNAAPLCVLDPGKPIAPPTVVLKEPFFISLQSGRDTFASGQLRVCDRESGPYQNPPLGHLMVNRAITFGIRCNQKIALLTMFYEVKRKIHVFGITSSYVLMNHLDVDICVSAIAVPNLKDTNNVTLQPIQFQVIKPKQEERANGSSINWFSLSDRWRGDNVEELSKILCIAIPSTNPAPVPIKLGEPPLRRAIALIDSRGKSMPVVVTQVHHEGRWLITVASDPCPQFVVHNRTKTTLAVAEPVPTETTFRSVAVLKECPGINWWCVVEPDCWTHYSTPSHCKRYPQQVQAPTPTLPLLTVGNLRGIDTPSTSASATHGTGYYWCQPIAIADGEHLLQLSGLTIKVRVHTHPHSTLIELLDVDQHDISASDIRRRLLAGTQDASEFFDARDEHVSPNVSTQQNVAPTQEGCKDADAPVKQDTPKSTSKDPNNSQDNKKETVKKDSNSDGMRPSTSRQAAEQDRAQANNAETYNNDEIWAMMAVHNDSTNCSETSYFMEAMSQKGWSDGGAVRPEKEQGRCVIESIAITMGATPYAMPLTAVHLKRAAVQLVSDTRKFRTTVSVAHAQLDNMHYDAKKYEFAVVATTKADEQIKEKWPPLWGMSKDDLDIHSDEAKLLLQTCYDKWTSLDREYHELTEVELKVGSLGLYIEDAFVEAVAELNRQLSPPEADNPDLEILSEIHYLLCPLRLRRLHIHPLRVALTLHTAGRIYIALDESPLRLNMFQIRDMMTSSDKLSHALTVHYLSAAILDAGWVLGGLELLGAPGVLAARLSNARGGVRGIAAATAGALLRSVVAAAGSLARNLDLLAGDTEHARRAAEARRRPPPSFISGLITGLTNFAINVLGAVGGIAHHPLVGVAVGESTSGASALRRGLVGAITKPLSATADLVAFAGHGLLTQTGWNPMPQPKTGAVIFQAETSTTGWKRNCVRWTQRVPVFDPYFGFNVWLDNVLKTVVFTLKVLIISDPITESVIEMINFKHCTLGAYNDDTIELYINLNNVLQTSTAYTLNQDHVERQNNIAAMFRMARYTGATGFDANTRRTLMLQPETGSTHALYAALLAAVHRNNANYFSML